MEAGRAKKETGRDQILRAAVDVLLAHGLRPATTRAVTERAGVGTGLLNHYFRWPELRAAAWKAIFDEVAAAQFDPDIDPRIALDRFFAKAFEPDARQYWQLWIEASDLSATDQLMADALREVQARLHDGLVATLCAGDRGGLWVLTDPEATALRLGALHDGLAALLISKARILNARDAERHLRAAFDLECWARVSSKRAPRKPTKHTGSP